MFNSFRNVLMLVCLLMVTTGADEVPARAGEFDQQIHTPVGSESGLPRGPVSALALDSNGTLHANSNAGIYALDGDAWIAASSSAAEGLFSGFTWYPSLDPYVGFGDAVRDVAERDGEIAVAADNGLYLGDGETWELALPAHGQVRWAPVDVRAVAYDAEGHLWFAAPQGVGYRVADGEWRLFTAQDGLPFNDFTCMAAGPDGVWFGTTNGAIQYAEGEFRFRQGRRWLLDNHVNDIAVTPDGTAWFATPAGVSRISTVPMTLERKAEYYLEEINKYHRYTPLGYVSWAWMSEPGVKETAKAKDTDNDGHYIGRYLGAVSLAYAATGDPKHKVDAQRAFKAAAFLSEVTQGGTHPGPKGLIARAVMPTTQPDPNIENNPEVDRKRQAERDKLWKIMPKRWPTDETGEWYWKCDASADELDGHFFGYGVYYDRVCETEEERESVREVVRRITDHLIEHDWCLTDYDGKPTRWGNLSPEKNNFDQFYWVERGLKSLSMLTYLTVTHHITGEQKYRDALLELVEEHGYAMNGLTQPKVMLSRGAFGQADDNMAFMNYYHLLRYETDPVLQDMFQYAAFWHWQIERYERNPFYNMIYAACNLGKQRVDQWGTVDLSPAEGWLEDAVFTLKRYPLDLVEWPMSNAHRIDIRPLDEYARGPGDGYLGTGHLLNGYAIPIDENHALMCESDPWVLTKNSDATRLYNGESYLLAYYMGRVHGFIAE